MENSYTQHQQKDIYQNLTATHTHIQEEVGLGVNTD